MKIILILAISLLISVLEAYGLTEYYSPDQALKQSDVSVVGKITSLKITEGGKTEYVINVEEFMKPIPPTVPTGEINLTAVFEEPFFEVGDRGLFFLNFLDDDKTGTADILKSRYEISGLSSITKSSCSGAELLDSAFVADELILSQNGKNKDFSTKLFTNQQIDLTFDAHNRNLTSQTMDFQFKVLTQQGPIFSEKKQIQFEECKRSSSKITWSFTPAIPGSYAIQILMGGKEYYTAAGLSVEDYIAPPLKQFKSGIAASDIVCKDKLQLVMKKSNGHPLCVKISSIKKLTEWKFIPEYNGWDSEIPVDYDVPDDFRISSVINGLTTLDTQKNLYSPDMCDPPIEFKLDLSPQESQQIWNSVKDNDFFELGGFNPKCGDLENCVYIQPEIVVTLNITANGNTHSVTHHNSYIKAKNDNLDKFENIIETLGKIASHKNALNNFTAPRCGLQ